MILDNTRLYKNLDSAIRFFLCVVIFWLPYSPAAIETGVILSLVLWLIKRSLIACSKRYKELPLKGKIRDFLVSFRPEPSPIDRPVLFFIIACLVSVAASVTPLHSLRGFITKTMEWFVVFFLVLEAFKTKKQIFFALFILIFTSLAVSIDSFVQFYFTGRDFFDGREILVLTRASASFKAPNGLGAYWTIILPLSFSFIILRLKSIWHKILLAFFLAMFSWSLMITFSRGAWLGVLSGYLFLLFYAVYFKSNRKTAVILVLSIIMISIASGLFLLNHVNKEEKDDLRFNTAQWRINVWQDSLKMIKKRPFFGYGLNTFMKEFQGYYRKKDGIFGNDPTYAHNCYLQVLAETGLFGLSMFLWIIFALFRAIFKKIELFYLTDKNLMILLIGLSAGIIGFLVQSFFDTNFYSLQLSVYLWLITGILTAILKINDSQISGNINYK